MAILELILPFVATFLIIALLAVRERRIMKEVSSYVDELFYRHQKEQHDSADWRHYLSHCCEGCGAFLKEGETCNCRDYDHP